MHYQYLFLHWNCEFYTARKYVFAVQNIAMFGLFSGALQQRYTDARATPHMTSTSMEVHSCTFSSYANVAQVLCDTHHLHRWDQCSSWPGDKWDVPRIQWHFYALLAIRIRPPSCCNVKAFHKMFACRVRVGTHDMHDVHF